MDKSYFPVGVDPLTLTRRNPRFRRSYGPSEAHSSHAPNRMSSRLYMQLRGVGSYLGETPQRRGDSVAVRRHCPGLNKPHALRNVKERARHHRRPVETGGTGPVRGRGWTPDRPELHVVPAAVSYARRHASQNAVMIADPVADHHIGRAEELAQTLRSSSVAGLLVHAPFAHAVAVEGARRTGRTTRQRRSAVRSTGRACSRGPGTRPVAPTR